MEYKDLLNLDIHDLLEKEKKLKEQLYTLNYQRNFGRVEKPHQFMLFKKDIARIKTAINQINKSAQAKKPAKA